MFYKIHHGRYGRLIAVCDEAICGKNLKGKDGAEFFVNPRFYKDHSAGKPDIIMLLKASSDANLVGEKSVQAGIEAGVIKKENVVKIEGVPHAQFTRMVV